MADWMMLFFFVLTIAILLLFLGIFETFVLDVSFSSLGAGDRTLRVFLLSDLHAGFLHISKKRFRKAMLSRKADVILFAGDMSCYRRDLERAAKYMIFFASLAREAGIPFLCVLGNHDLFDLHERLEDLGIIFLQNQSIPVKAADGSVWLVAGLEDFRIGNPSYKTALKRRIRISQDPGGAADAKEDALPVVVLAHNPDSLFLLPETTPPDLRKIHHFKQDPETAARPVRKPPIFLLSGHFHGGQIWMPFHFEYRVLREELLPKIGIRRGAFQKDGVFGYISRGLGSVIVPIRLFSPPELAFLELRAPGSERALEKTSERAPEKSSEKADHLPD